MEFSMKKYFSAFCVLAAAAACTPEQEAPEASIEYAKGQQSEIIAAPEGGEIQLGFVSSGVWDATTVENWLELESISGKAGSNVLTVTVDENDNLSGDRSGAVRIMSGNKELVFTVSQSLNDKAEAKGETAIELDRKGGSATVEFKATKAWKAETKASWLTLSATEGEAGNSNVIKISAPINIEADRSAEVRINCGTYTLTYTVSQKYIDGVEALGNTSVTIPELGGEATIVFSAVTEWTAASDAEWLTLSATSGSAGTEISLKASAGLNVDADRTASVTVKGGKKEIVYTVSQKMATSTLSYTSDDEDAGEVYVYASNGTGAIAFIAAEAWTAAADADWVAIETESGEPGTYSIGIAAENNTSLAPREAVITVTSASGKSTLEFYVYQNSAFGDYCGYWTASGVRTASGSSENYTETWLFADSSDEPGNGGMKGLLGESKYWGSFVWEEQTQGAKIVTGADNVVNLYNFGSPIGVAAIVPVYLCSFETSEGPKKLLFYSYEGSSGVVDRSIFCFTGKDNESMNLLVFTYDKYPNPTSLVTTKDFEITYGIFEAQFDDDGYLTGTGNYLGYTYGGIFKVNSVTRGTAATAAINAAVSKVTRPANQAKPLRADGKIPAISADKLEKCENAVFVK